MASGNNELRLGVASLIRRWLVNFNSAASSGWWDHQVWDGPPQVCWCCECCLSSTVMYKFCRSDKVNQWPQARKSDVGAFHSFPRGLCVICGGTLSGLLRTSGVLLSQRQQLLNNFWHLRWALPACCDAPAFSSCFLQVPAASCFVFMLWVQFSPHNF